MLELRLENSGLNNNLFKTGKIAKKIKFIHENLHSMDKSSGTGWVELPTLTTKTDLMSIKEKAKEIQEMSNLFIVIGVGGAVNGTRAGIEILKKHSSKTQIVFVGDSFDAKNLQEVLELAKTKEVCVNVVSKSGETLETLVAFQLVEEFMKKKYKKGEYKKRIFVTTDHEKGKLREIANKEGYYSFVFPRTIGGRYSLLSIVGLLPMAVAGINIEKIMAGAKEAENTLSSVDIETNPAYQYAITRYFLNKKKKKSVEVFASFDKRAESLFTWIKQLFLEGEGKNKNGIFISSLSYPTDLHSFGQFMADGTPILFETFINLKKPSADILIEKVKDTSPLSFLCGKSFGELAIATQTGVEASHREKGVSIITISVDEFSEEEFGCMAQFFMTASATSAYLFGVNPFDQPAVEDYKEKTRRIIGN